MKKRNAKRYRILLLATLLAAAFGAAANNAEKGMVFGADGHEGISDNSPEAHLKRLVNRSDLVFHGRLIDISEGLSIEKIPYTFATYKIVEVVSGRYADNTITLKFVGGKLPNGNRIKASNSPSIKVGEESVLMVQQSIDVGCDFVDCEGGRFVVEKGALMTADDSAVVVSDGGKIEFKNLTAQKNGVDESSAASSNLPRFISQLKRFDRESAAQGKKARTTVVSAQKDKPFKAYAALTKAGRAPEMIDNAAKAGPKPSGGSAFDQWEVEQLRKNGGNPLLNESFSTVKANNNK